MRFYTQQHRHYCGIDLHARSLYVCILDQAGKKLVHQKLACDREQLLRVLRPYRKDLAIAVECLFCWYWVADLCAEEGIEFVLDLARFRAGRPPLAARSAAGGRPPRVGSSGSRSLSLTEEAVAEAGEVFDFPGKAVGPTSSNRPEAFR